MIAALAAGTRIDVTGSPLGVTAMWAARYMQQTSKPLLLVVDDNETARRLATSIEFFTTSAASKLDTGVLVFPSLDTTPYPEIAPDRRSAMDRLATLFHLAQGLPWKALITPVTALIRRVPPREAISSKSRLIESESELDRDELVSILAEGGYLRVPVVEDPGTFSVRGSILDVFPPRANYPARIEFDDWLVTSIKLFDPEDQRTVSAAQSLFVHPARDMVFGKAELDRAITEVRTLCEHTNWPTSKTRALIDDLSQGRMFFGVDNFLPAFYPKLETLFDYLPPGTSTVVLEPTHVARAAKAELEHARSDYDARVTQSAPALPLQSHYILPEELVSTLTESRRMGLAVVHTLAMSGHATPDDPLEKLELIGDREVCALGGEDQRPLVTELTTQRARDNREDAVRVFCRRAISWLDAGLAVTCTARTTTQAERMLTLFRGFDVPIEAGVATEAKPVAGGKLQVALGELGGGFLLAREGVAYVTEEEIFGTRTQRRAAKKRGKGDSSKPFIEDLRELVPGDYVVHTEHGVGKYLGLEKKTLGLSQFDQLRGEKPLSVEVLVIEYAGGDKLFLPVTRLNFIQKHSGKEGHAPKTDRLGGQTFAKTKSKAAREIRQLADELLRLYAQRKAAERDPLPPADRSYTEFEATFPFDETPDQAKAIEEVLGDFDGKHPMDRVVCGDVGFGKTEVALRAAFRAALAGRQVAILCPTTVLAQQHFSTFKNRLREWPLRIEVLSRFVEKKDQTEILAAVKEGKVDIVVGTHRLLSKDVHFKNLGLLVVDEEQRFGVVHKERIKQLRAGLDVLTLSATPIPRTLQLAIGGLRDLSLITTAPVDRRAVRTFVCRWDDQILKEALLRERARGGQSFFVYNRIEGLYERAQRLQALIPDLRIAVAHGQLNETALERIMGDFVEGRYDVLCATAIIESGLDIPRANTMIIDRADTFGLSQLYQLRGRVGRSRERAYCYLVTPPPSQLTDEARFRMEALERFTELGSGFHVASLDMELRGAGDFLGAEQSGNVSALGFDLFIQMLNDTVAELRGEPVIHDIDPELTLTAPLFIPDDYIEDVGLRLSFYKRLATADDADSVTDVATEIEDRFGKPPNEVSQLVRAMRTKPALREYRVLGCEGSLERVTLHLREDTPLDPAKIMRAVAAPASPWRLTPDMKLTRRFGREEPGDVISRVEAMITALEAMRR